MGEGKDAWGGQNGYRRELSGGKNWKFERMREGAEWRVNQDRKDSFGLGMI